MASSTHELMRRCPNSVARISGPRSSARRVLASCLSSAQTPAQLLFFSVAQAGQAVPHVRYTTKVHLPLSTTGSTCTLKVRQPRCRCRHRCWTTEAPRLRHAVTGPPAQLDSGLLFLTLIVTRTHAHATLTRSRSRSRSQAHAHSYTVVTPSQLTGCVTQM